MRKRLASLRIFGIILAAKSVSGMDKDGFGYAVNVRFNFSACCGKYVRRCLRVTQAGFIKDSDLGLNSNRKRSNPLARFRYWRGNWHCSLASSQPFCVHENDSEISLKIKL